MTAPRVMVCSRCGNPALPENGGWVCYSDGCEVNGEYLRSRERKETAEVVGHFVLRFGWLAFLVWLAWTGVAHCQDRPTDEEVIALTFISEEGWDREDGWASLGAVIRWRAEEHHEGDLRAAAVALSPRLHVGCRVTRTWLCDLSADLHRPRGLGATWTTERSGGLPSRRDRWVAALAAARALLAGGLPDSCLETPHAWGSWADVAMRIRNGERWDDAGCPGRNRYGRRLVRR